MEISDLPDNEFKMKVIKTLTDIRRAIPEKSEDFNSNRKWKYQTEITKLKEHNYENSTEGFSKRQAHVKEGISKLKDSAVESDRRRKK